MVFAEELECTDVNVIRNTSGEFGLTWETPSDEFLKSWRVEFTLSGSYVSTDTIFWTFYFATADMRSKGITLSVTEALHLQIKHDGDVVTSDVPWLTSGNSYTMAFQFILFENNEGVVQKGEFSVVSSNQILSYVIEDLSDLEFCAFRKSHENSKVTRFQEFSWSHNYSDIALYRMPNRVIPEPSTTVMSVLATILLSFRRRRR